MARTNLRAISVYVDEDQLRVLTRTAAKDNRSLSNFLLTLGLEKAEEYGVSSSSPSTKLHKKRA